MARRKEQDLFFRSGGRQNIDESLSCLHGADYHLKFILKLESLGLTTQQQANALHYHIRAFFWELYAVADSIDHVERPPAFVKDWAKTIRAEQWFLEVDAYRNLAHRMFHLVEVMRHAGGKLQGFYIQQALRSQTGMVGSADLREYLRRMALALDDLTAPSINSEASGGE